MTKNFPVNPNQKDLIEVIYKHRDGSIEHWKLIEKDKGDNIIALLLVLLAFAGLLYIYFQGIP